MNENNNFGEMVGLSSLRPVFGPIFVNINRKSPFFTTSSRFLFFLIKTVTVLNSISLFSPKTYLPTPLLSKQSSRPHVFPLPSSVENHWFGSGLGSVINRFYARTSSVFESTVSGFFFFFRFSVRFIRHYGFIIPENRVLSSLQYHNIIVCIFFLFI